MAKLFEINRKMGAWLRKLIEEQGGEIAPVAARLKQRHDYISRQVAGTRNPDPSLSKLAEIAKALNTNVVGLMGMVEAQELPADEHSEGQKVVSINAKYAEAWDRLFEDHPLRGKRVLTNLLQQEELGYTDLVSRVVRAILDQGPKDAIGPIVAALTRYEDEKETQKRRNLRTQLSAEYRKLR